MKINWKNVEELLIGLIAFIGMIVFSFMFAKTEQPLAIMMCLFSCNIVWLGITYDIVNKIRG